MKPNRIKNTFFTVVLVVALGLLLPGSVFGQGKTMNLRYAYDGPPRGAFAESNKWFAEEITRRSNGKLKITIHWGGTLIKMADSVAGIGKGVAECGAGIGRATAPKNPHWETLSLFGAGNDLWALVKAAGDMYQYSDVIKNELAKLNIVATHGYTPGSPRWWFVKEAPKTIKDLKGKRIAIGHPIEAKMAGKMGVVPVNIPLFELYDALDRGVVDAGGLTVSWAGSLKFQEVINHSVTFSRNKISGAVSTLFNLDVWNSFSPATRALIYEVVDEYEDRLARATIEAEANAIKAMKAAGVTFARVNPEIDDAYQKLMEESREAFFQRWDKKGVDTRKIWKDYQELVAKYEKEVEEKGYPWER